MRTEDALLGGGYAVGIPLTLVLLRICWRRWTAAFVALEAAAAAISAGWFLKDNRAAAWSNLGWGVGFLATWIAVGRRRRERLGPDA